MTAIEELLALAGQALVPPATINSTLPAGEDPDELSALLEARNGFFAFDGALHVRGHGNAQAPEIDLTAWNHADCWRCSYHDLAEGLLFFAEDAFGGQFALGNEGVVMFEPETGRRSPFAFNLEGWASALLTNPNVLTGWPIMKHWQQVNGPLGAGRRLVPKKPFIAGGEYRLDNLIAISDVEAMKFRGELASHIRNLPEGTQIRLVWT